MMILTKSKFMNRFLRLISVILLVTSCSTEKETLDGYAHLKPIPIAKLKYSEELTFDFRLYEQNDSLAKLYFDIQNDHLLSKRDSLEQWTKKASLEISVRKNALNKEVITKLEKKWLVGENENFTDSLVFSIPKREDLYFSTLFSDLNKLVYFENQNWWLRKKSFIPEQFILVNSKTKKPIVKHFILQDSLIIKSDVHAGKKVTIKQYKNLAKPASAPFSMINLEPDYNKVDTSFTASFTNNCLQVPSLNCFNIVSLGNDKSESIGFFTYNQNELAQACKCLTYICSAEEMEKFNNPMQQESFFEQFWLKAARNDKVKANFLKKEFLRRIQFANQNFSSYKLGSLTDLGMIYIVYGDPTKIEKDGFQQNWYYAFQNGEQTRFTFMSDQTNIVPNNYFLERGPNYRSSYFLAVENWRSGMLDD